MGEMSREAQRFYASIRRFLWRPWGSHQNVVVLTSSFICHGELLSPEVAKEVQDKLLEDGWQDVRADLRGITAGEWVIRLEGRPKPVL